LAIIANASPGYVSDVLKEKKGQYG